MSQIDTAHAWWSRLRHNGLLLSPVVMLERYTSAPELAPWAATNKLREAQTRFTARVAAEGEPNLEEASILAWVDALLDGYLGHKWGRLVRQNSIPDKLTGVVRLGSRSETIRPHRVLYADANATVPALLVMADTSAQVGRGRGRTTFARFLELLRGTGHRLGLLTNGFQFRLIYAGLDFESWCEWESDRWFDDGEGSEELAGLRQLLSPDSLKPLKAGVSGLLDAVEESRKRQADLSSVLRENVRQAVEYLLEDVSAANRTNATLFNPLVQHGDGPPLTDAQAHEALYQATVRVVMRLVVCLFAESRQLLPTNDPIFGSAYGVRSLYELLEEAVRTEGGIHALFNQQTAWPRLMALFRLIHGGSAHGSFPLRAYGGALFRPGDAGNDDPVARALHILEHSVLVGDSTIHAVLRKLLRGPLPVMRGRQKTFVEGPVDYTDLRTEFIGLIYEGLLDYRIKRTNAEIGPQVFLNIGREPVLPLKRLEDMLRNDRNGLKNLLTTLRKETVTGSSAGGEEEESGGDEEAEESPDDQGVAEEEAAIEVETELPEDEGLRGGDYLDAVEASKRWAREAVVLAGLVGRQRARESDSEYQARTEAEANRLIKRVVATGEFYLVRAGNTRKGTGTFYTRPQLAVPTVHRTLEPLCYEKAADGTLTPREPETVLGLKVCDPACGSASFLVAALHYLTDALYRSLCQHRHLDDPEQAKRLTLPYGRPRTGEANDELVPFPPDDPHRGHRFAEEVKARLTRHVVERCIYGVDINPLAVELARVSLWVETLNRDLPFSFLDHKIKVGNSLVGCWLDRVEDYPIKAWEREGGDGKNGERTGRIETFLKGEKVGNRRTGDGIIKREMIDVIKNGFANVPPLFPEMKVTTPQVAEQIRVEYESLHNLPAETSPEDREVYYREHVLGSPALKRLKRAMDEWCAVWFWPSDEASLKAVPTPLSFHHPSGARDAVVDAVAADLKFFHWELEFPDVFSPLRQGFDALVGNPPWETLQQESLEFFSNHDPLYRTLGKQEALRRQRELFQADLGIEAEWFDYCARFSALSHWVKNASDPFDVPLERGSDEVNLKRLWSSHRGTQTSYAHSRHPFSLQGTGKIYTYKLFCELFWCLLQGNGRLGVILPTGVYSDLGTKDLREEFLYRGRLDLLYAFQNEKRVFAAAHHSYKQVALLATRGGTTSKFVARFRMGVGDSPEAHEIPGDLLGNDSAAMVFSPDDVKRNSPKSLSLVELRSPRDMEIFTKIYDSSWRIGDNAPGWEVAFTQELNMTTDSKMFPSRAHWEAEQYSPDVFGRWIKDSADIAHPFYQGVCIHQFDACFKAWLAGMGRSASWEYIPQDRKTFAPKYLVSQSAMRSNPKCRLLPKVSFRQVARSTDTRSMIASVLIGFANGNKLPSLCYRDYQLSRCLMLSACLNSFVFDHVERLRNATTDITMFVLEDLPLPKQSEPLARVVVGVAGLTLIHRRFSPDWLKLKGDFPRLGLREWKVWWAVTEADRLRLRVEIDAICADLYGLDPDDFDWILRDDPSDSKGFYRVDRQLPFRERLTGLAAAAFRALKEGKWSAESAASLSNDEFFEILGIPELTSTQAAHAQGLPGPLIEKRDGCHVWRPESFPAADPRHGWTWDDCWNDAVALLGSEEAVRRYVEGDNAGVDGSETQPMTATDGPKDLFGNPLPTDLFGDELRKRSRRK